MPTYTHTRRLKFLCRMYVFKKKQTRIISCVNYSSERKRHMTSHKHKNVCTPWNVAVCLNVFIFGCNGVFTFFRIGLKFVVCFSYLKLVGARCFVRIWLEIPSLFKYGLAWINKYRISNLLLFLWVGDYLKRYTP